MTMTVFAVQLDFDQDEERRLEVRPRHRDYLQRLTGEGRLRSAGPFADGAGALLVYEVTDRAELDAVLADDPYFSGQPAATVASIREWQILPLG